VTCILQSYRWGYFGSIFPDHGRSGLVRLLGAVQMEWICPCLRMGCPWDRVCILRMSRERWTIGTCCGFLENISRRLAQDTTCPVHLQRIFATQVVRSCFCRNCLENSGELPVLYAAILRDDTVAKLQNAAVAQSCSPRRRHRECLIVTCSFHCLRIAPNSGGLDVNR
jgi:hypothetical protein